MTAALFVALMASLAYGAADFLGGVAARGAHILRVVVLAAPASLVVALIAWPTVGAEFQTAAVGWGVASGFASAASFALLYRTLAIGPMSVLSPVTALVSAILPVAVGLIGGEELSALAFGGMLLALVAIVIVSGGTDIRGARPSRTALLLAFSAGSAIAFGLVCLDQAPDGSGAAALVVGRTVAMLAILTAALGLRAQLGEARPSVPAALAAGALDSLANLLFLIAVEDGDLAIIAVITALYPAGTVLLARVLLGERIGRLQLGGLGLAAVAVSLLALG